MPQSLLHLDDVLTGSDPAGGATVTEIVWYSTTENGYRQTIPELQVRDRAFQVLQKLSTRFGLDPSSRAGLGVVAERSPDFAEEFLFKPL